MIVASFDLVKLEDKFVQLMCENHRMEGVYNTRFNVNQFDW